MNENDQNFEQIKRLLKLKQHEIPPPGYFNNFSDNVIARIKAGEANGDQALSGRLQTEVPWLFKLIRTFEARPGMIGGFATSLCLLLILGVVFAEYSERTSKKLLAITEPSADSGNSQASLAPSTSSTATFASASDSIGIVASTNPITSLQPTATLFGQPASSPLFQSASFAPAH